MGTGVRYRLSTSLEYSGLEILRYRQGAGFVVQVERYSLSTSPGYCKLVEASCASCCVPFNILINIHR